jgi:uncharacterized protein
MGREFEYPKKDNNTVNRLGKNRGKYDLGTIHRLVQNSLVVHVSFTPDSDDPFPAILPMIGTMGSFDRPSADINDPIDCYLHGYVSSRIMNLARKNIAAGGQGVPVCIAASKVDGLVLAATPNAHSYNYRSAILFGYADLVTDVEEKLWAMELITNKVVAGRWENSRLPPNAGEMSSTQILRVKIDSGSSKIRAGPPADAKFDLEDDQVMDKVWTGVVPIVEQLLEPVPSAYNRVKEVPEHISQYRKNYNDVEMKYVEGITKEMEASKATYGDI